MTKEIRNCQFKFECPRSWDSLEETADERVRHCNECNRMVVLCRTSKQLKRALMDDYCVAIEVSGDDEKLSYRVGDVDYESSKKFAHRVAVERTDDQS